MDWSYVAGFFDGEGGIHIGFNRSKTRGKLYIIPRVQLSLAGTHQKSIKAIFEFLLSQNIACGFFTQITERKPEYTVKITLVSPMKMFIDAMEPLLIIKQDSLAFFKEALIIFNQHKTGSHWTDEQLKKFGEIVDKNKPFVLHRGRTRNSHRS